jgi:hypothetical protein
MGETIDDINVVNVIASSTKNLNCLLKFAEETGTDSDFNSADSLGPE